MNEEQEEAVPGEFTRYQIHIPDDDFDEDDEMDARLDAVERKRKRDFTRGGGIFGTS